MGGPELVDSFKTHTIVLDTRRVGSECIKQKKKHAVYWDAATPWPPFVYYPLGRVTVTSLKSIT